MRILAIYICILTVFILMISGCKTVVSEYCFSRAKVSDGAILWKNDNAHKEIYKVGDKYYVRGYRGRVRQTMSGMPVESVLGLGKGYTFEWVADEKIMEEGFVLLERNKHTPQVFQHLTRHSNDFIVFPSIEKDTPEFVTHLPAQAEKVEYPFDITIPNNVCLINPIYVDKYAYIMYPLGVVSYMIDLPFTFLGFGYQAELINQVYRYTQ